MNDVQKQRLIDNEVIARTNNRMAGAAMDAISEDVDTVSFFCECSAAPCKEHIPMSVDAYTKIHEHNNHFMITPGHDKKLVEFVKKRTSDYWVVEKYKLRV